LLSTRKFGVAYTLVRRILSLRENHDGLRLPLESTTIGCVY